MPAQGWAALITITSLLLVFGFIAVCIVVARSSVRFAKNNAGKAGAIATKAAAATIEAARQAADSVTTEAHKMRGNSERSRREEDAYAIAAKEVESGDAQPGLWAKAFADAGGDQQKQKALYLKYRSAQIVRDA